MNYLRKCYLYLKKKYQLLTAKKYSTLAGTLVFFLIMSIVPLSFWLTLLIGKLPINTDRIFSLPIFDSVENVLSYVRREASNATASVSVVLIVTTLYSSTTFFYQMRRSGEIIYDYRRPKKGLHVRAGALLLWTIFMTLIVTFLLFFALGAFLFSRILPYGWEKIADYFLLLILSFLLVFLLNMYVCPYKTHFKRFLPGTFVTIGAWALALIGFSIYIKIGNVGRLYGTLSTVIVFLLWLYVLMICFIIGVIINSERITRERQHERKYKRRKRAEKV
ncbi:MAG: YihY/virulence factor BrkB family protein [Clostridiales bacterium]|nr:YihY/virulence factor BrkB family protein [Clostridiales bacterium]